MTNAGVLKTKQLFPWLIAVVEAIALIWLWHSHQQITARVEQLQSRNADLQQLQTQLTELQQAQVDPSEIARLKRENAELHKLRNEVSKLKADNATRAAMPPSPANNATTLSARLTPEQVQQVVAENEQMRVLYENSIYNKCVNNMRQLDGALDQWAIEFKKNVGDVATTNDIAPYLKQWPVCPSGGVYTFGVLGTPPTCTVHGTIPPPPP